MANEKRLIDANALVEKLQEAVTHKGMGAAIAGILIRYIEKLPTVDAVEVVHGRWSDLHKIHGFDILGRDCSVCGYTYGSTRSNYCPNCGAKMDGDGNG